MNMQSYSFVQTAPLLAKTGAVNFHFIPQCDSRCAFCFSTFQNAPSSAQLSFDEQIKLIKALGEEGCRKINFVGGEPTLYPKLAELLHQAKQMKIITSIVTNGYRLKEVISRSEGKIDWVGLSVDSTNEEVQHALGRGSGDHVARIIILSRLCRDHGIRLKLNTVVTSLTWQEDMSYLVLEISPERWKLFQVLQIIGQNEERVEPFLITSSQFSDFVERHKPLRKEGISVIAENNDAMTDSYLMIDPRGRFISNTDRKQSYSDPILDVGVSEAIKQIGFQESKFIRRGGKYDW